MVRCCDYKNKINSEFNHILGPSHWVEYYPKCGGNKQSPIDVFTRKAIPDQYSPMAICFQKSSMNAAVIANNGHTIELSFPADSLLEPFVQGGGPLMNESYAFARIHFHWGERDRTGSETNINRRKYKPF